jgi:hypothetical protein
MGIKVVDTRPRKKPAIPPRGIDSIKVITKKTIFFVFDKLQ